MQYFTKPVEVSAFQMKIDNIKNRATWPHWLDQACANGRLHQNTLDKNGYEHCLDGRIVTVNDWIVREKSGALSIYTPGIFEELFERHKVKTMVDFVESVLQIVNNLEIDFDIYQIADVDLYNVHPAQKAELRRRLTELHNVMVLPATNFLWDVRTMNNSYLKLYFESSPSSNVVSPPPYKCDQCLFSGKNMRECEWYVPWKPTITQETCMWLDRDDRRTCYSPDLKKYNRTLQEMIDRLVR